MKKILMAGIAVAVVAMAGFAWAESANVTVSATVRGNCRFLTSGELAFVLDPADGGPASAAVTQQSTFWCTKGKAFTIAASNGENFSGGSRRMKGPGDSDFIPYILGYSTAGTGAGRGSTLSANLTASVIGGDYINASEGAYSDLVVLTISP